MSSNPEIALRFELATPTKLVYASVNSEDLLGYTPAQLIATSWSNLIHPDDHDIMHRLLCANIEPACGRVNLRVRHANGKIRCVSGTYLCASTAPLPATVELHLQDARQRGHTSEPVALMTQFVAMMENTDDFIYFKDRQHVFIGASQTLVTITNPTEHWTDLIDQTDYDVFPENYADQYYQLEKQIFAGATVARDIQPYLANDGRKGWVDNRKYPIHNDAGDIIGLFGIARDITELRRAEQALTDSERRFHTIFDEVPAISVQGYDRQRRVIFWNKASESLYGYTREQALGRQLESLIIPPPMRDAVISLVNAWCDGGPSIPAGELTLQHADGSAVEVFSSHVMLRNVTGEPEMYCIDINISERKATERALQASEAFARTILDEIPDPVVIKDARGDFLLCNRTLAGLYNTSPEAMVGKHDDDFGVPKHIADGFRENVLAIMAKGETQTVFEDSRDAVSGEIRHYRSIKKPFKSADGQNQILVIAHDITDVIRAQQKVAESEQRLQQVMEITREGIWDWHIPSGLVLHNPQWYQTLHYSADEIADTVDAFVSLIHPDDRELVSLQLNALLSGSSDTYHSEHRLIRKDGQAIWVQDRGRIVERDAAGQPVRVVGSFSDISFQRAHQNHLEYMAHYDTLTGLPNRVLLADRMQQAIMHGKRHGHQLVVAYLDLDGFKAINDRHGHDVGDQLLTLLAAQFKATLREGDTVARLGGDEFVAVFVDLPDVQASLPLIQRLLEVASSPLVVNDTILHLSASIGISTYPQADEVDADLLLRQADQAMYSAKTAGKNRYHLFDAEHDHEVRARNESRDRIRQALTDHEFVLYYQPKVNLRTGVVIGVEALIRWQHPQLGLLAPGTFLPEVAGHAIEVDLGEWVLETALTQMEHWRALGLDLPVSVNVAGHHLQQPQFVQKLKSRLAGHPQVQPGRLELEVLETSALQDMDLVADIIKACAEMGVSFSLDDFGTGYSSLTYLKRLPAQTLKIDRSFIYGMLDDPENLAIVQGVLGLAAAFKRSVIAEGVETAAHCRLLLQLGCELAQGFGIARPMPAADLPAWIDHWQPDPDWLV